MLFQSTLPSTFQTILFQLEVVCPSHLRRNLLKAFKDIAKTKKGKKILENIYQHYGYVDSKDSNFNIVREYEAEAKKLKNKFNIF